MIYQIVCKYYEGNTTILASYKNKEEAERFLNYEAEEWAGPNIEDLYIRERKLL